MEEDICLVESCGNFKQSGDLLFCFKCRESWRNTCKINGIEEIDIPEGDTKLLLNVFCGRISLKEYYEGIGWEVKEDNENEMPKE